jgi:hypothetical protein
MADAFQKSFMRASGMAEERRLEEARIKAADEKALAAENRQRDFMREQSLSQAASPEQFIMRGGQQWDQGTDLTTPPSMDPRYKVLTDLQKSQRAAAQAAAEAAAQESASDRQNRLDAAGIGAKATLGAASMSARERRRETEGEQLGSMIPSLMTPQPWTPGDLSPGQPTDIATAMNRARQLAGVGSDVAPKIPQTRGPLVTNVIGDKLAVEGFRSRQTRARDAVKALRERPSGFDRATAIDILASMDPKNPDPAKVQQALDAFNQDRRVKEAPDDATRAAMWNQFAAPWFEEE